MSGAYRSVAHAGHVDHRGRIVTIGGASRLVVASSDSGCQRGRVSETVVIRSFSFEDIHADNTEKLVPSQRENWQWTKECECYYAGRQHNPCMIYVGTKYVVHETIFATRRTHRDLDVAYLVRSV